MLPGYERPDDRKKPDPANDFDYDKYLSYLNSEAWAEIRNKRLAIDDYKCAICRSPYSLEVHHLIYPSIFGTEPQSHLVTLCRTCHKAIEDRKKSTISARNRAAAVQWYDAICLRFRLNNKEQLDGYLKKLHGLGDGEHRVYADISDSGESVFLGYMRLTNFRLFAKENPEITTTVHPMY